MVCVLSWGSQSNVNLHERLSATLFTISEQEQPFFLHLLLLMEEHYEGRVVCYHVVCCHVPAQSVVEISLAS
jgi:hypothetical protein